jgi:ElaB/YqjD/DUF883 family membrane-anchored ribosome-binding protein
MMGTMSNLATLTSAQLKRAAALKDKIESLSKQLDNLLGKSGSVAVQRKVKGKKRGMSAAGRARIAAAQRARWAKVKAAKKG